MNLTTLADICVSCIGYAIRQVETSEIDIMGCRAAGYDDYDTKQINLKQLAEAYMQLDNLTYTTANYAVSYKRLSEILGRDVRPC
jgi:hypothetical protein